MGSYWYIFLIFLEKKPVRAGDVLQHIATHCTLQVIWLHIRLCLCLCSDTHNQAHLACLWTGWGNFVYTDVVTTVVILQLCILNAASVWKRKEGMQQGEWSLANKLLQELICVVLQGYSWLLCNFSAHDVVFVYKYSFEYAYLLLSEHFFVL